MLLGLSRLDSFINFAYRALKSHRDGRGLEARLDAVESIAPFLDVVFALHGRVRPYNKYLEWELREHPLPSTTLSAEAVLPIIIRLLTGSPDALVAAFAVVESECREQGVRLAGTEPIDVIEAWGSDLALLRGQN